MEYKTGRKCEGGGILYACVFWENKIIACVEYKLRI